jgi:hypothetical protein
MRQYTRLRDAPQHVMVRTFALSRYMRMLTMSMAEFVNTNPAAFVDAFFEFNAINVYTL